MHPDEPILALDPAMLADHPHDSDDSDSYEYEYDDTNTETVYLNIDLTSLNGPLRPPRRRTEPSSTPSTPIPSSSHDGASTPTEQGPDRNIPAAEQLQILGLHTCNPLISYQNQIFSCSWADQVGTELFFTPPENLHDPIDTTPAAADALRRGKDFDLIAANRVKLLGRKANLISSSGPPSTTAAQGASSSNSTQSHPLDAATNATYRKPGPQTNQSRFLDRLSSVKRAKGETDQVRTVYSMKRPQNLEERLRGWARTEEQVIEIQQLHEAVMQGDTDAMTALENLYLELSGDAGTE